MKTVIANSLDENFRASCIIKSIQNYEKSNLRECLREVLSESGYKVVNCTLERYEAASKKVKEATEVVKRQNSADIFNAEKVAPDLVDELKFDASWEERCKVIQAKLREKLPGIEDSPIWTEDFIYLVRYRDRNFISNIESYWLFINPDVAKRQSQDNLHWMARRLHTFIGNVKSRWARIHALLQMGFERFLDPSKEWTNESPEVIELVQKGKQYSNALGKRPGKSTPVQFLGILLGLFGLRLKSRKDSEDKRWYCLDQEVLNDPTRQQVLACIEAKLTQPKEEIDWDAAINEAYGVKPDNQPANQTEQASEGTAPSPQILYTNQLEGAVNNLESQGVSEQVEAGVSSSNSLGIDNQPQAQSQQVLEGTAPSPQILYTNQLEGAVNKLESQGGNDLGETNPVEELVEVFESCENPHQFAAVIEGYSVEVVEDAIALADSQPRRRQLTNWHQQLSQEAITSPGWKQKTSPCQPELPEDFGVRASVALGNVDEFLASKQELDNRLSAAVKLVKEAIRHGADTVRCVLSRLDITERWWALDQLPEDEQENFGLMSPQIWEWMNA